MAKFIVDENLCSGCGTCENICPECFKLGDDYKSHVLKESCDECDPSDVVAECPMGAISYE